MKNFQLRSAARSAALICSLLTLSPASSLAQPSPPVAQTTSLPDVIARLRSHAVTYKDFARSVFYTWTSPEQVAALRTSKTLLVSTANSGVGRASPFIRMLRERVQKRQPGHEVASLLLDHPALEKRRYAWTSPYATVLGLGDRTYGTELIQVTLLPSARIVRFDPEAANPFAFVNLRGEPVPYTVGIATPEAIGAIYHVRTRGPSDFLPFREFILCSEAMVQSFSVATDEIRARVNEEKALMNALRPHFATLPAADVQRSFVPAWSGIAADAPLLKHWQAAAAFDNRKYRAQVKNLDKIIAGLDAYGGSGPPFTYTPRTPH